MDAIEKRANGVALNGLDEQRLRNHQLRMMRRAWLKDMKPSPREPFWPQHNLYWGASNFLRANFNFTNYWKLLSDKLFLAKGVRPFYPQAFFDELFYGRLANVPRMALWGSFRMLRYAVPVFILFFGVSALFEELALAKFPTCYGLLPTANRPQHYASFLGVYPSDKTFTTRLRNVEWNHDWINIMQFTPRMNPDAETYPRGTRMNWVTYQPIYPEDNYLLNENYGNGPGGLGNATETYRLVHATKPTGLYSKVEPGEVHYPMSTFFNRLYRACLNRQQADDYNWETDSRQWSIWHGDVKAAQE